MSQVRDTAETLAPLAKSKTPGPTKVEDPKRPQLYLPTLKVISYFGPGTSGGVSTSLEPIVNRLGSKVHWFSIAGLPSTTQQDSAAFSYYSPRISKSLLEKHNRFVREYLWPLIHGLPLEANLDAENWKAYKHVCEIVASECLTVSPNSFPTLCWLHDYQLALTAPLISMQAGMIVSHFWHSPWPEPSSIVQSLIAKELVEALLANRLLGFQTQEYATNFIDTVQQIFPIAIIDRAKMEIRYRSNITHITAIPLSVDFVLWQRLAVASAEVASQIKNELNSEIGITQKIILGIDRLDSTKGVLEKLSAIGEFLKKTPTWRQRFTYVQIVQAPRAGDANHPKYKQEFERKVSELNTTFGQANWKPIKIIEKQLDQKELAAWYQAADVLAINSIREGLNLMAKEYIACRQDNQGILLLSKQAGLTAELAHAALLVDPQNPDSFYRELNCALSMTSEEQHKRMMTMRNVISDHQLHNWALDFLHNAIATN